MQLTFRWGDPLRAECWRYEAHIKAIYILPRGRANAIRCQNAERAVRAGLELVEAVAALRPPVSLQTRVGVATGLIVAGKRWRDPRLKMSLKYTKTAGNLVRLTDVITHDDLRRTIARLIEEARRMVTEQKGRIARLKATGVDIAFAELTLRALEANLKRFQNHADWSERKEQNPAEPSRVTGE